MNHCRYEDLSVGMTGELRTGFRSNMPERMIRQNAANNPVGRNLCVTGE